MSAKKSQEKKPEVVDATLHQKKQPAGKAARTPQKQSQKTKQKQPQKSAPKGADRNAWMRDYD